MACFIDEIKGIIVDPFDPDILKNGKLVFLSNFYKGTIIPKSSLQPDNQILCCTLRTMQMLRNVGVEVPSIWQELEIGRKYDFDIPTEDLNERPVKLKVTAIDAGHCTGSCMFLFETMDKSVLYTSEFRLSTFEISRIKELREPDDERKRLDALYVDCFFIKHDLIKLPTLKSSVQIISTYVKRFLNKTENGKVYVYSFEANKQHQLIRGLATCTGKFVYIHRDIVDTYKDIPHMCHYITNKQSEAAIHLYQNEMTEQTTRGEAYILKVILENEYGGCNDMEEEMHNFINNRTQISRRHAIHATSEEITAMVKLYKPKRVSPCYIPSDISMEEANSRLNKLVSDIKPANDKTLNNCEFYGFIDGIDFICADRFGYDHIKKCSAFFLSHCHYDHMNGLKDLSHYPDRDLYCTRDTEKILKNIQLKLKLPDSFFDCIRVLDVGKAHKIHVPAPNGSSSRTSSHVELQVTPINANHCLGACMFLFETRQKRVLYTGDFRFYESQLPQIKELHESDGKTVKPIDLVYLDTTFFNQVNHTKDFPTVEESLRLMTESIDHYQRVETQRGLLNWTPYWIVFKQISYLGTEEILMELSRRYKTKFHLNEESYIYYEGFEKIEACITKNRDETIFHFCNKQIGTPVKNKCELPSKYLLILPTALKFANQLDFNHREITDSGVVRVAFSKHCSHKELDAFLRYFKPKQAISCANSDDNYSQQEKYYHSELQHELDKLIDEINHAHDASNPLKRRRPL